MGDEAERWGEPGALTTIDPDLLAATTTGLPGDAVGICRVVQGLVVTPDLAPGYGIADDRQEERSIRSASAILRRLLELDPAPVVQERRPQDRVVGTCRHFAVLSTALLRHAGVPARARCGFATYFVPGQFLDHWVTERQTADGRWVRTDAEIFDLGLVGRPEELAAEEFLTGGEAWQLIRAGGADPGDFGVHGAPHAWGIAEVRGNAIRDLAALGKIETLPWDEWGPMPASYAGETGPEVDALIDRVAEVCAGADPVDVDELLSSPELAVPVEMRS